jgi:predicted RNA methylase
MRMIRRLFTLLFACTLVLGPTALARAQQSPATTGAPQRQPDVIFVPTPTEVVQAMLKLARITPSDVVYDLGSGDGRIPIAAAKSYGAHGVGIDIDPERTREAMANARGAGVADKVTFRTEDVLTADIGPATVVMLYLSPAFNHRLAPKLMKDLKPGTRIVSHAFDLGDWKPQQTETVNGRPIYLWIVGRPAERK